MSKVNKAFSLDPEVFVILDKYCMKHEEIGSKRKSRSAVVNNAIRWYLGDQLTWSIRGMFSNGNSEIETSRWIIFSKNWKMHDQKYAL